MIKEKDNKKKVPTKKEILKYNQLLVKYMRWTDERTEEGLIKFIKEHWNDE